MTDELSMMERIKNNIENDSTLSSLTRLIKVDGGNLGSVRGTTIFITCLNPKNNPITFSGTTRFNVDIAISFVQPMPTHSSSNEIHRQVMDNLLRVIEDDHSLGGLCNGIDNYSFNNPQDIEDENVRVRDTTVTVSYKAIE